MELELLVTHTAHVGAEPVEEEAEGEEGKDTGEELLVEDAHKIPVEEGLAEWCTPHLVGTEPGQVGEQIVVVESKVGAGLEDCLSLYGILF